MPDPWSQTKGESAIAYAAFRVYLDLGPSRSLKLAWQAHSKKNTVAAGHWRRWSTRFAWTARARAWDSHHESRDKTSLAIEVDAHRCRLEHLHVEREIVRDMLGKLREMMSFPMAKRRVAVDEQGRTVTVWEPIKWNGNTMVRVADLISKMGRLLNRMPTEIEDAPAADFRDLFFDSEGDMENSLPAGSTPAVPSDVMAKPAVGYTPGSNGNGNGHPVQPSAPVRP